VPYYLGIDGGGTKTTCAVGDQTSLLVTATAGPSNVVRVGETVARHSLQQSVRQACAVAGIATEQVSCTCVGGSGAGRAELAAAVRGFLAEILSTPITVVGDMEIALEAAFDHGPGVIVVAGTGSIAYGRDRQGRTVRAGGWGFAIGDEGSAHWIGKVAVNAVLRASDRQHRGGDSELAASLSKEWKADSLLDLARAANAVPPRNFAALFPSVAGSGDQLAQDVLGWAGRELAEIASVVIGRLFAKDQIDPVPVAMTGGVFRHSEIVREVFYNELRRLDPRAQVNPRVVDPVEGALRLARQAAPDRG
jgi:glucosamine kinase